MTYQQSNPETIPSRPRPSARWAGSGRVIERPGHPNRRQMRIPAGHRGERVSDDAELADLIEQLVDQQSRLQFTRFTNDDAWELGSLLVRLGRERELVLTVDIRRHGHQLFHAALAGTTPDNDSWIERKIAGGQPVRRLVVPGRPPAGAARVGPSTRRRASSRSGMPRTAGASRSSCVTSASSAPSPCPACPRRRTMRWWWRRWRPSCRSAVPDHVQPGHGGQSPRPPAGPCWSGCCCSP